MLRIALCGFDYAQDDTGGIGAFLRGLIGDLGGWETDSRDACPYNIMFAEQTFQDTEGVISRNASRFISSIRMANAFQDGFAVISSYGLVEKLV